MASSVTILPILVAAGLAGGAAGRGCSRLNNNPDVHPVGSCLRGNEYVSLPDTSGYFHLIVDKTANSYVICQGQFGPPGFTHLKWYGCDVRHATYMYNDDYTEVPCPSWPIDDNAYEGTAQDIRRK